MATKRVAVIGAGPSGLTALKACAEEGFAAVCFERSDSAGGLWRYRDEPLEGVASVMRTTVINTSKEISAFSDFPPPAHFPNFMHNSKMFEYFMLYGQHFDVLRHIRYNLEVVQVDPAEDFQTTGRWIVTVRSTRTEAVTREVFDAVMVCVGHHVYPQTPKFKGQEKFHGTITHTHELKTCERYVGQRVVVVGIGNSGVDAAVDCTFVADKVYLSTRRGTWLYARLGPQGLPYDVGVPRFVKQLIGLLPFTTQCSQLEKIVQQRFDHAAYGLLPKHRALCAHPTLSDSLPAHILSGRVSVRKDIDHFEEDGVVFVGDHDVTPVDAVVLATGYHIRFPFLNKEVVSVDDNKVSLYKLFLPPELAQPTLALIGLVQPLGPIFPIAEMQSRFFIRALAGKVQLPSRDNMLRDIKRFQDRNANRYVATARHTVQIDWMPYLDDLASKLGCGPSYLKLLLTDPKLLWGVLTTPPLPYHYRLRGPHAWSGARHAILTFWDRIYEPLNSEPPKSKASNPFWYLLLVGAASATFFYRDSIAERLPINFLEMLKLKS